MAVSLVFEAPHGLKMANNSRKVAKSGLIGYQDEKELYTGTPLCPGVTPLVPGALGPWGASPISISLSSSLTMRLGYENGIWRKTTFVPEFEKILFIRFILSRGWPLGNWWEESGIKSLVPELSTNVFDFKQFSLHNLQLNWVKFFWGAKESLEWTCRQRRVKLNRRGDECCALDHGNGSDYRLYYDIFFYCIRTIRFANFFIHGRRNNCLSLVW